MQDRTHEQQPELWGGIECTINRIQDHFFDQLDYAGHYQRPDDLALLAETGIRKIRYPVLWEKHQLQKGSVPDWQWTGSQLQELKERQIDVIAGLVHHGSGPHFTSLLDDAFPSLLASYAQQVIERFPHLHYFTPVNEPLTTARFSGLYGLWYPHLSDDASFFRMLLNELKGTVLAMQAIRKVNPNAKLVQTEDLGKTYSTKSLQYQADFENERRWLTYDILCGRLTKEHPLWKYVRRCKVTEKELAFFEENACVPDVFGFNHYLTSERFLDGRLNRYPKHTHGSNGRQAYADVEAVRVELREPTGLSVLLKEAWQRYLKPMAVTEVHLHCHREEQLRWFEQVWSSCQTLRSEGVQIEAVTAWAMLGSFGWNKLLTEPNGDYEPGVFDVRSGTPRATALASYLKTITTRQTAHPLTLDKGWWQRNTRFFRKPELLHNQIEPSIACQTPILIFGKNGTLGRAFARICKQRFLQYKLLDRQECDVTDLAAIRRVVEHYRPWAIVNAAGFVRLEEAELEQERCFAENVTGPRHLAEIAAQYGIQLVTFSSDLVFDGNQQWPYTESDQPNPINLYGLTKAKAETAILGIYPDALVVRTSAFFGPWDQYNFAHFVRQSLQHEETIQVASDAVISPTYVPDLVHATLDLLVDQEKGIWHLANEGELSWSDFACEIADRFGLNRKYIKATSTEEFQFAARRPLYSVLSSSRGILLPKLENALRRYTEEIQTKLRWEQQELKTERA